MHNGFVILGDGLSWEKFRFRPEILSWYRELHPLTDAEVREAVGRHIFELATTDGTLVNLDAEAWRGTIGASNERIVAAVRGLEGAGFIKNTYPIGSNVPGFCQLTERGFQWAMIDFKADRGLSPRVEVTVNVEIQQVIDVIANLPVSDEERKVYELTALRLERELQKSRPAWSVIKDALEMAANSKELAVPLVTVLANHKDQIVNAIQQLPIS